jgi:hypothetical protein
MEIWCEDEWQGGQVQVGTLNAAFDGILQSLWNKHDLQSETTDW